MGEPRLTDAQADLLTKLAERDTNAAPERAEFRVTGWESTQARLHQHRPLHGFVCHVAPADLEELRARGLVRVEMRRDDRMVCMTNEGLGVAERLAHRGDKSSSAADASPQTWKIVLPVLRAVGAACDHHPVDAGELGVTQEQISAELGLPAQNEQTALALVHLKRTGYIEGIETMGGHGPRCCRPTEKGLAIVAGWPTSNPEALLERFLHVVDEQAAATADPHRRSLLEKLRETVKELGPQFAQGVAASWVGGQFPNL